MELIVSQNEKRKPRKYSAEFRKNIVMKISKLKLKKDFIKIYNIINKELGSNISINRNGIFFNINILSDDCIEELCDMFKDSSNTTDTEKIKSSYF
jgi:hypothetical protein